MSSPGNREQKAYRHKRTGNLLQVPEDYTLQVPEDYTLHPPPATTRYRSNSSPSSPSLSSLAPSFTLRHRGSRVGMSQRSAVARIKLEKTITTPTPEPPHKVLGKKSSSRFNGLFSSSTPDMSNTASTSSSSVYQFLHPNRALSVSSLQYQPEVAEKTSVPSTPLRCGNEAQVRKLVVVSRSIPEELHKLRTENAALIAENTQLRASLDAERIFSAKLSCFLQEHHESEGRVNQDPGNLGSAYYRGLEDEQGNRLLSLEIVKSSLQLLGDAEGDSWDDGNGVDEEVGFIAVREVIAMSFEPQRD